MEPSAVLGGDQPAEQSLLPVLPQQRGQEEGAEGLVRLAEGGGVAERAPAEIVPGDEAPLGERAAAGEPKARRSQKRAATFWWKTKTVRGSSISPAMMRSMSGMRANSVALQGSRRRRLR